MGKFVEFRRLFSRPSQIESPNGKQGDVRVTRRARPITGLTNLGLFVLSPIVAMLARPGLGAIARAADKLEFGWRFLATSFPANLIWHAMVDLQIAGVIVRQTNGTSRPKSF